MNPFSGDRFREGGSTWEPLYRAELDSLAESWKRCQASGESQILLLHSPRSGFGKSHLLSRLAETGSEELVRVLDLHPGNLEEWIPAGVPQIPGPGDLPEGMLFLLEHLDGFYGNRDQAGMKIASLLRGLAEHHAGSLVVMAVNEDLWQNLFLQQLPGAMIDSLTEEVVSLSGMTSLLAEGLVLSRLEAAKWDDDRAVEFLEWLSLKDRGARRPHGLGAREVFRWARGIWDAGEAKALGTREEASPDAKSVSLVSLSQQEVGEESDEGEEEAGPMPPRAWTAAEEARNHLHEVAERLRRQADPSFSRGGGQGEGLSLVAEHAHGSAAPISRPLPDLVSLPTPQELVLPRKFQQLRVEEFSKGELSLGRGLMHRLLQTVGAHFPRVHMEPQELNGREAPPPAHRVVEWRVDGMRIRFGLAPLEEEGFWRGLTGEHVNGDADSVRLCGFFDGRKGEPPIYPRVEVIVLAPDLIASLRAADRLLHEDHSDLTKTIGERCAFLSQELEGFWVLLLQGRKREPQPEAAPSRSPHEEVPLSLVPEE
ncbi:MAG: hypothetical protein AAGJ31_00440 [Verrucomicrobiota bacterium]